MSSLGTIYQVIDTLSKDKGIDAKVIAALQARETRREQLASSR